MAVNNDRAEALNDAKATVAFYAGMRQYQPMFATMGFDKESEACVEAFEKGDMAGWVGAITDEMAETFVVLGPPDECRKRVEEVWDVADSFCLCRPSAGCRRRRSCSTSAGSPKPSTARSCGGRAFSAAGSAPPGFSTGCAGFPAWR